MDNRDNEMMAYLEEQGALIWDGMNKDGEAMFKFDLVKLKDVLPPLYDQIMADLDQDLMELYKAGMVDIEYDENLNAKFKLSQKGMEFMENFNPNERFDS